MAWFQLLDHLYTMLQSPLLLGDGFDAILHQIMSKKREENRIV